MTPTKEAILEKAKELFVENSVKNGIEPISPTENELKENGFFALAQTMLIQDRHRAQVEEYFIEDQVHVCDFEVDIEELLRSGCFIAGGKGTTKSNLAMLIADRLMRKGIIVKVFDISKAWLRSSVPHYVEANGMEIRLYQSMVFDLSKLTPKQCKQFIAQVLMNEWELQTSMPEQQRKPICYIFEEVQVLIPQGQLRSNEAQQVLRLMTTGRNYDLSYVAITQRPALTDTSVFELTFQHYFSRMDGQNDLRKVANYIRFEKARELQNLKLGEFVYDRGSETKWITTKEFHSSVKPQTIFANSEPIKRQTKEPNSDVLEGLTILLSVLAFGFIVGALLL